MSRLENGPRPLEALVMKIKALKRRRKGRLPKRLVPRRVVRLATCGPPVATAARPMTATRSVAATRPRAKGRS